MYGGNAAEVLDRCGANEGDTVEVVVNRPATAAGKPGGTLVLRGMVMGPFGPDKEGTIVIKLDSGYNFALTPNEVVSMRVTDVPVKEVGRDIGTLQDPALPLVAIIGTGGTIASYVDRTTGAVRPVSSAADLLYLIPELVGQCRLDVTVPLSKLSEDMTPGDWSVIASEVVHAFERGARGVVVTHGTDTMAYTGAALSFSLRDLPGPVVLTGAQRSSDRPSSDSFLNLKRSLMLAASSDLGEVCILMHSSISDDASAVHRACRVRKMHTSRRDAFVSVNSVPLGMANDDGVVLTAPYRHADPAAKPRSEGCFSEEALLVWAQPTLDPGTLVHLGRSRRALVIAGTGLGHVRSDLLPVLRTLTSEGRYLIMASQCLNGRVNPRVYSSGRAILEAGTIEAGDMTPETSLVKAMWCLGTLGAQAQSPDAFRELFNSNVCGEHEKVSTLVPLTPDASRMEARTG